MLPDARWNEDWPVQGDFHGNDGRGQRVSMHRWWQVIMRCNRHYQTNITIKVRVCFNKLDYMHIMTYENYYIC